MSIQKVMYDGLPKSWRKPESAGLPVLAAHWAKPVVAPTQTVYSGGVASETGLWGDAIFREMLGTKSENLAVMSVSARY
ncbi:hypothetical protein ACLUWU_02730 [Bifidobacterium thermophilum]|uniref:hypothetical protein n=1 Tax=Bifidobacterium thermophilum TaxID=33905 RepID=UPI003993760A